jgi:hypothetical protein
MAQGYVSDRDGDDTVMDEPDVTVSFRLANLPPQQAFMLAQYGECDMTDEQLGQLARGEDADLAHQYAEFHLPLQAGLVALTNLDVLDLDDGEEPTGEPSGESAESPVHGSTQREDPNDGDPEVMTGE